MMGGKPDAESGDYWIAPHSRAMTAEAAESILAKRTRGSRRRRFGKTNPRSSTPAVELRHRSRKVETGFRIRSCSNKRSFGGTWLPCLSAGQGLARRCSLRRNREVDTVRFALALIMTIV